MRVKFWNHRGSKYDIEARGARTVAHCGDWKVLLYQTEAGGVTEYTVALVGGQRGAMLRDVELIHDRGVEPLTDKFAILPGGIWSDTTFVGGSPEAYFAARYPQRPVPEWAPAKLAGPFQTAKIGPYGLYWNHLSYMHGGQGIDPGDADYPDGFWMEWRRCPEGYHRAWKTFHATAQRNPIAYYLDRNAHACWRSSPFYSLQSDMPPPGYVANLDRLARWWPDVYQLGDYHAMDGQHALRGYRDALVFRGHPFADDYLQWWLNRIKLAWFPDALRDGEPHYYGTARQVYLAILQNQGPHYRLGREFAHVARLVWLLEPDSDFAAFLEEMIRVAASGSCPSPYMTIYQPEHPGVELAACFELHLLLLAMRLRPWLRRECRRLLAFVGTEPDGKYITPDGQQFGEPMPFTHLWFGELGWHPLDYWTNMGAARQVEAGGSQPLNYMPEWLWRETS